MLYELEDNALQANLTQARASVTSARVSASDSKLNLDRTIILLKEGATSNQSYEQARSSYEIAQAQLVQASANYDIAMNNAENSKIKSEIDGEIVKIYVNENDSVVAGTMIMQGRM